MTNETADSFQGPKATSKIVKLQSLDPELWSKKVPRIIQSFFQPQASLEPIDNSGGWLLYRGIYYYSDSDTYPHVMLVNDKHLSLPIVKCCNKRTYDLFLSSFFGGDFNDCGIAVGVPSL
jgi:hypothetical protein